MHLLSYTGLIRNNNEDSARIESFTGHNKKEFLIAALADGVGGMSDGEIAISRNMKMRPKANPDLAVT